MNRNLLPEQLRAMTACGLKTLGAEEADQVG